MPVYVYEALGVVMVWAPTDEAAAQKVRGMELKGRRCVGGDGGTMISYVRPGRLDRIEHLKGEGKQERWEVARG